MSHVRTIAATTHTLRNLLLPPPALAPSQRAVVGQMLDPLRHAAGGEGLPVVQLLGGDAASQRAATQAVAAEALAHELGLSPYRIDLSAVVSTWTGETEKNLRRLFAAAGDSGAILFFDEADALFGQRSEAKDSHDRYANIEVNCLLQRLESFRGFAILATNTKGTPDRAFPRRLRFVVNFPFPGTAERRAIWASVFPPEAAVGALDFDWLARFALTGGRIQGIALNAAFMAASAGAPISMPVLLDAVRGELRKLALRRAGRDRTRGTDSTPDPWVAPPDPAGRAAIRGRAVTSPAPARGTEEDHDT